MISLKFFIAETAFSDVESFGQTLHLHYTFLTNKNKEIVILLKIGLRKTYFSEKLNYLIHIATKKDPFKLLLGKEQNSSKVIA